jgi:predicted metalloprotease with PDZ domain
LRGGEDNYYEGMLIWLDVDTLIRSKTAGRRPLDDFAKDLFGRGEITGSKFVPDNLRDIVSALNEVIVHDWQELFQRKVLDVSPQVNVEGLERAGYRFRCTNQQRQKRP